MTKSNGFSLIELIIVLAIMGAVLAVAAPNFMAYRHNANLKEAARELSSDIQYWKQKAVAENVRYRILLDTNANSYSILQENPKNSGSYVQLSVVDAALKNIKKSPADINANVKILSHTFTGNVITMQPRGTLSAGTVILQHTLKGSEVTITTNLTGRVGVTYDLN